MLDLRLYRYATFESLVQQTKPVAVEPEHLQNVATPPAKDEDVA